MSVCVVLLLLVVPLLPLGGPCGHQPRCEEDSEQQGSQPGPPGGHGRPAHQGRGRLRQRGRGENMRLK